MQSGPAKMLAVLVGEESRWQGKPLHEQILMAAHDAGLEGATVLKGFMGFGIHHRVHDARIELLMENLPLSLVIVDRADKIDAFLGPLKEMLGDGTAHAWPVNVHPNGSGE